MAALDAQDSTRGVESNESEEGVAILRQLTVGAYGIVGRAVNITTT